MLRRLLDLPVPYKDRKHEYFPTTDYICFKNVYVYQDGEMILPVLSAKLMCTHSGTVNSNGHNINNVNFVNNPSNTNKYKYNRYSNQVNLFQLEVEFGKDINLNKEIIIHFEFDNDDKDRYVNQCHLFALIQNRWQILNRGRIFNQYSDSGQPIVTLSGNDNWQQKVLKWTTIAGDSQSNLVEILNDGISFKFADEGNAHHTRHLFVTLNQTPSEGKWVFELSKNAVVNRSNFLLCPTDQLLSIVNDNPNNTFLNDTNTKLVFNFRNYIFKDNGFSNSTFYVDNPNDIKTNIPNRITITQEQNQFAVTNLKEVLKDLFELYIENTSSVFLFLIDLDNRRIEIRNNSTGYYLSLPIHWSGPTSICYMLNRWENTSLTIYDIEPLFNIGYRVFDADVPKAFKTGYGQEIKVNNPYKFLGGFKPKQYLVERPFTLSGLTVIDSATKYKTIGKYTYKGYHFYSTEELTDILNEENRDVTISTNPFYQEPFKLLSRYGGYGYIKSIVLKGTTETTPVNTYVALVEVDEFDIIKVTKTNPETGEFEFTFISEERDFNVLAFDPDKGWVTAIAGPIKAKRMPDTEGLTFNEYDYF